jgi:hypothetical protein
MTRALVRASARSRLMILAVVAASCVFMRVTHALSSGADPWAGSDMHEVVTLIVLGLVIPTFVGLLGTMLLRSEHAPWSWALARPIGRARLVATLVAVDVATIAACVGLAAVLIAGFGGVLWQAIQGPLVATAIALGYALLYLATAIGGARGMSSLRAGVLGIVWIGGLAGLGRAVFESTEWLETRAREVSFAGWYAGSGDAYVLDVQLTAALTAIAIGVLAIAMTTIGVVIPFLRAAAAVPAMPRWRSLLLPPAVTVVACVVVALATVGIVHDEILSRPIPAVRDVADH